MVQQKTFCSPAKMSDGEPAPREWPPVDLIAGLSLETIAEPESELDAKVHSGRVSQLVHHTLFHFHLT